MIESLWKRILRRRGLSLWSVPAGALWILSFGYRVGAAIHRSRSRPRVRVNLPVISIGNIAVGGSGKTPLVAMLARGLIRDGLRVGIVSSGYKRSGAQPFVEAGRDLTDRHADETGDEVHLLAGQLPEAIFSVNAVKTMAAARLAERGGIDLIIVDDGFQHFGLCRDLDIVAFDAAVPRSWLRSFPYGVLREPLSALARADIVVITRADFVSDIGGLKRRLKDFAPTAVWYDARYKSHQLIGVDRRWPIKYIEDKTVLLFAGVGHFDSLRRQVQSLAGTVVHALELSDHQRYDVATFERILRLVDKYAPDVVLTTGKDWVKARHFDFGREFYYLDLAVDLNPGEEHLASLVRTRLGLTRGEN